MKNFSGVKVGNEVCAGGGGGGGKGVVLEELCGERKSYTAIQRMMILDMAMKSGFPIKEFADLVGVSAHVLYGWKKRYDEEGVDGLADKPRGRQDKGSRLPEVVKKAILMIREAHPEYGCERISDMLGRGPGLGASPGAVLRVIREAGLEVATPEVPRHEDQVRRFERARPNQLWQTDVFTFTLKRENRRLYMVAFLDDNSRYVVGYGVYATMTAVLVIEALKAAIGAYGAPEEVLTDNGPQYHTWRGKSRFGKELERLGIKHILARPRHPQTVGKAERFWGTLWRECVERAVFMDVEDARKRIGHFIDHYNFQRPHQGIDGLVPADRYFGAKDNVKSTLLSRVAQNALELARDGMPRKPFYLTGRVGDVDLSIHAEGERVVMTTADGLREEVDLRSPGRRVMPGKQCEMPEPLAVHGEDPKETDNESNKDSDINNRERGCTASDGDDAGGDEWSAYADRSSSLSWDVADEVLPCGEPCIAGDGDGFGAEAEGAACEEGRGRADAGNEGAGPSEEGCESDDVVTSDGEEGSETWGAGAAPYEEWEEEA